MRVETQFSVFLVNKPGVLAQVTELFGKARINIVAMTLMDSSEHGVLRFVCDNTESARELLKRTSDHWTEAEVLVMELPNEPGALARVAGELAAAHVNITYAYTSGGAPGGRTTCVFRVADLKKSQKVLERYRGGEKGPSTRKRKTVRPSPSRKA